MVDAFFLNGQNEKINNRNRISAGFGGEDGYFGVDYSRDIYRSKISLGIGCGLGTGWTIYTRYEPLNLYGFCPFVSAGISHSFNGTLILSKNTSVFSASSGLNYFPKLKWTTIPWVGIGITYYSLIQGNSDKGSLNGLGPLIKIGIAFPKKQVDE